MGFWVIPTPGIIIIKMKNRRAKKTRIVKKRSRKMARAKRSRTKSKYNTDTLHVKCVAFATHQYRDIWAAGDDKTAARRVVKWDTTELAGTDMTTPASSEAFL